MGSVATVALKRARHAIIAPVALLLVVAAAAQAQNPAGNDRAPGGSRRAVTIPEVRCTTKGCDIARHLIAKSGEHERGWVGLSELGDEVCLVPRASYAAYYAERYFPGYELTLEENFDSDGYWFIIAGENERQEVRIFKVDLRLLNFPAQFVICTTTIGIKTQGGVPTVYVPVV